MAATFGISHIALKVADLDRSSAFYKSAFGVKEHYRDARTVMLLGPGPADLIALDLDEAGGKEGGIDHFGMRLTGPEKFEDLLTNILASGGRFEEKGDRGDNQPYAFVTDPDGNRIEIWHMNTPLLDPG